MKTWESMQKKRALRLKLRQYMPIVMICVNVAIIAGILAIAALFIISRMATREADSQADSGHAHASAEPPIERTAITTKSKPVITSKSNDAPADSSKKDGNTPPAYSNDGESDDYGGAASISAGDAGDKIDAGDENDAGDKSDAGDERDTEDERNTGDESGAADESDTSDERDTGDGENGGVQSLLNAEGMTIQTRFHTPDGYSRVPAGADSFAQYLRDLPLKKDGEPVLYFDGSENSNGVYAAVVNQPISSRDLHQCADAIMRLRAQYLFQQGRYDEIAFHFVSGFLCDYASWRAGSRVKFRNDKAYWDKSAQADSSEEKFQAYLEIVYAYASTLSLDKELTPVSVDDMQIGDVFIRGGSPGHAIIVVDMAEDGRGGRCFMLAQSYMPAQQTHILRNYRDEAISPWYSLDFGESLSTPQWTFTRDQLKRFP
jgi:hypothetical protein